MFKKKNQVYKNRIKRILGDFYYDSDSISCEYLKEMALFLNIHKNYGPKGIENVALCFYQIDEIISDNLKNKNLLHCENGEFITLGEVERRAFLPHYDRATKIFERSREIPIIKASFDLEIAKECFKLYRKIMKENDLEFAFAFQDIYGENVIKYLFPSTPKERYCHLKRVKSFYRNYYAKKKMNILEEDLNLSQNV